MGFFEGFFILFFIGGVGVGVINEIGKRKTLLGKRQKTKDNILDIE